MLSINVSSIITGQSLARIPARTVSGRSSNAREAALKFPVKGFAYDERTQEIFTGNSLGICCVWSNKLYKDFVIHGMEDYNIDSIDEDVWKVVKWFGEP